MYILKLCKQTKLRCYIPKNNPDWFVVDDILELAGAVTKLEDMPLHTIRINQALFQLNSHVTSIYFHSTDQTLPYLLIYGSITRKCVFLSCVPLLNKRSYDSFASLKRQYVSVTMNVI